MPKVTFKMSLRIKGCERVFAEGFEPGVLVTQEATYDLPDDYDKTLFAAELLYTEQDFIKEHVEVTLEEIEEP